MIEISERAAMEYDYRNRTGSPYDTQLPPMYGRPATGAPHPQPHPMYGQQAPGLYPRVGQPSGGVRNPPIHHTSSPSSNSMYFLDL